MKKYDIGSGSMGNGLTYWNRAEEINHDYKTIAHINHDRAVTFYEKLPEEIQNKIIKDAANYNGSMSATQDHLKVFDTPQIEESAVKINYYIK